jgi:hypothetical protein
MRILRQKNISYKVKRSYTEWAIEKKTWKRDMEIILNWISLGSYRSFPDRQRRQITDYILKRGRTIGTRTFFKEEEMILVIPAAQNSIL